MTTIDLYKIDCFPVEYNVFMRSTEEAGKITDINIKWHRIRPELKYFK